MTNEPQGWIEGSWRAVALPDGSWGHACLLSLPHVAFVALRQADAQAIAATAQALEASPILFTIAVHANAVNRWPAVPGVPLRCVPPSLPDTFMQDPGDPSRCTLLSADGSAREVGPEACVGLERAAVWTAAQAESRLWDSLNGRENTFAKNLEVRLPRTDDSRRPR